MVNEISASVKKFYNDFPYPTGTPDRMNLLELLSFCLRFTQMTGYNFNDKNILDAGTGTGDRIIEFAKFNRNASILAMDFSFNSLQLAREKAAMEGIDNIDFIEGDILQFEEPEEKYDAVFSMGVIHHLASPERGVKNLSKAVKKDGFFVTYLYGLYGGRERMRNKETLNIFSEGSEEFDYKLEIASELNLEPNEYGWLIEDSKSERNQATFNSLLADSYFNVNEELYNYEKIYSLFENSGFEGFNIFGITVEDKGYIVDFGLDENQNFSYPITGFEDFLNSEKLKQIFRRLPLVDQYKILDLVYQPNGYTIISWPSLEASEKVNAQLRSKIIRY